ncbi:MAG: DNRLRE domain-containing protein, partial [bacterium]
FNWYDNITSSQTVVSATLRLTIDSFTGASNYHIYGTNDNWTETTVTWDSYVNTDNKNPDTSNSSLSLDNTTITSTGAYDFDVTSYVQTVHNADNTSLSFWVEDLNDSEQTIQVQTQKSGGTRAQLILSVR